MSDGGRGPTAETQLRLLGPVRNTPELTQLYAYPEQRTWVRANFIASLDGAATSEGRSGGLAGPGDRVLFHLLRSLADVIVVGAGTVRTENYGGARMSVAQRQQRQARGQSEVPQLAIVTNSGRLDRDLPVFTRTEVPPLILTCTKAAAATLQQLAGAAEVVDCSGAGGPERVDEAEVLAVLAARDLNRVLTEGGPMLLGSLIERNLLDDLCLTLAPCLVGGQARRIATGPGQVLTRMRCAHLLTDDSGYLYTRYVTE